MPAGDSTTWIPDERSAAIFSAAVPLPPAMIAPAWPMRRPGGAVCPAMNATIGLVTCARAKAGRFFLGGPADLADHDDGLRVRVVLEEPEHVDEVRADDRISADPDARGLSDAAPRELVDRLVGERPAARDDPDVAFLVDGARQ
jgi:hypothetical protein